MSVFLITFVLVGSYKVPDPTIMTVVELCGLILISALVQCGANLVLLFFKEATP